MKGQQLRKNMWKPEEDMLLKRYVETYGEGKWSAVSKKLGLLRDGKSCRLRWKNYLRPDIKHGSMSKDEEDLIIRMHKLLGNRWSLIAGRLPGRTDNEVKNYWNSHLSKKTARQAKRKPITGDTENSVQKRAKFARIEQSGNDIDQHHRSSTRERTDHTQEENNHNHNHSESKEEESWSTITGELVMESDKGSLSRGFMDMGFMDDRDESMFMIYGGDYNDRNDLRPWDHAGNVLFDTFGSEWEETILLPCN